MCAAGNDDDVDDDVVVFVYICMCMNVLLNRAFVCVNRLQLVNTWTAMSHTWVR